MKNPSVWLAALAVLCYAAISSAETVYYWTDENGVRHFSNTGAPDDVEEVGSVAGSTSPTESDVPADAPEGSSEPPPTANEPDDTLAGTPDPDEAPLTARERAEQTQQDRMARRAENERRRLQDEIAQVEGRSLSRTFTEGMRDNLLAPLKEQLALLDADPARYFRMKQQGAFVTGGRTSSNRDRRGGRTGAMRDGMRDTP